MKLSKEPSMHWFRRRSTKWMLCLVATLMPLQALPAKACQCAHGVTHSAGNPEKTADTASATLRQSCCSQEPACCSARASATVTGCCGCCQQPGQSSPCNCGDDCRCSLRAPTPATPALPPASSSPMGDEVLKSQAIGCHLAVDTALPAGSSDRHPLSSVAYIAPTTLDLCATFCRFLL